MVCRSHRGRQQDEDSAGAAADRSCRQGGGAHRQYERAGRRDSGDDRARIAHALRRQGSHHRAQRRRSQNPRPPRSSMRWRNACRWPPPPSADEGHARCAVCTTQWSSKNAASPRRCFSPRRSGTRRFMRFARKAWTGIRSSSCRIRSAISRRTRCARSRSVSWNSSSGSSRIEAMRRSMRRSAIASCRHRRPALGFSATRGARSSIRPSPCA